MDKNKILDDLTAMINRHNLEIEFHQLDEDELPYREIWKATITGKINGKKYDNTSISAIAADIWSDEDVAQDTLKSLTIEEIHAYKASFDDNADGVRIVGMIKPTDMFIEFCDKYIIRCYDTEYNKVHFYRNIKNGKQIRLFALPDATNRDTKKTFFRDQLEIDDRLDIFEKDWADECANDYEFFAQFCEVVYKKGKPVLDDNGRKKLVYPDPYQFMQYTLLDVKIPKKNFPVAISNDNNTIAFTQIDLNELANMQYGDTAVVDAWMASRFRDDQIDFIEKLCARCFYADAPDLHGLYIYDENGKKGKSTFINAVVDAFTCFNMKHCGMTLSGDDKHKYAQYLGCTIAVESDVKSPNFVQTDLYHHVTAGDICNIDIKNRTAFAAKIKVTPLLAGNIPIQFDYGKEHMSRRIAFIKMQDIDPKYLESQQEEINGVKCWKNSGTFAKQMNEQMYNWIIKAFQKNVKYNLAENEIVLSKEILEDTADLTREQEEITNDMIIDALSVHFDFTGDFNNYVKTTDIFRLFMINGPEKINVGVNLNSSYGKNTIINAIAKHLGKNKNDIHKKKRIGNARIFVLYGIKAVSTTGNVSSEKIPTDGIFEVATAASTKTAAEVMKEIDNEPDEFIANMMNERG